MLLKVPSVLDRLLLRLLEPLGETRWGLGLLGRDEPPSRSAKQMTKTEVSNYDNQINNKIAFMANIMVSWNTIFSNTGSSFLS